MYKSQFALAYDLMTTATQQQQCVDTNCTVTAIDNAMIKVLNGLLQNRYLFCIAKYPAALHNIFFYKDIYFCLCKMKRLTEELIDIKALIA